MLSLLSALSTAKDVFKKLKTGVSSKQHFSMRKTSQIFRKCEHLELFSEFSGRRGRGAQKVVRRNPFGPHHFILLSPYFQHFYSFNLKMDKIGYRLDILNLSNNHGLASVIRRPSRSWILDIQQISGCPISILQTTSIFFATYHIIKE